MRIISESTPILRYNESKIHGVALVPGISRNENLYTKGEMEKGDGAGGILNWEHDASKPIGTVQFHYDRELQILKYEAEITDPHYSALVKSNPKKYQVSIEAEAGGEREVCNLSNDCFKMPNNLEFIGMAITETPGVVSTTLAISESTNRYRNNLYILPDTNIYMAKVEENKTKDEIIEELRAELKAKGENMLPDAGVDREEPEVAPPKGQKRLDGDNVPADNNEGMKHAMDDDMDDDEMEMKKHAMKKKAMDYDDDDMKERVTGQARYASASDIKSLEKKIEELTAKNAEKKEYVFTKPTFDGSNTGRPVITNAEAMDAWNQLETIGRYKALIDLGSNQWLKESYGSNKPKTINEAITFAGDQSNKLAVTSRINVRPGGFYGRSVRDLVRFHEIPHGVDEIKQTFVDIPVAQTFTEGTETPVAAHPFTTVALSADTVSGNAQFINSSQIEDTPQELLPALAEAARISAIDYEANLVFNTAAQALNNTQLGDWIDGQGGQISGNTDNAVSSTQTFGHEAIAAAVEYLETQGYDAASGEVVCALHPKQYRQLITDSGIERYIRDVDSPGIRDGIIPSLYGVKLVPMNKVAAQNNNTGTDTYRAVCFVPDRSFILGSKRELEIDIQKRPRFSGYDWSWTQRKQAIVYDAESIVRISSPQ